MLLHGWLAHRYAPTLVGALALATAACSSPSGTLTLPSDTSSSTSSSSAGGGVSIIVLPDGGHPHDATKSADGEPDPGNGDDASTSSDGEDDASFESESDGTDDPDASVGADDAFAAAHSLPVIPDLGGPVLSHPTLVTVTYANDPQRSSVEQLGAYLVTSPWLSTVGPEYGVGLGKQVVVELPGSAPATIDDVGIQALVASLVSAGTAPDSDAGVIGRETAPQGDAGVGDAGPDAWNGQGDGGPPIRMPQDIYMMYFPATTALTIDGSAICDISGGGYHSQTALSSRGQSFVYGVITDCPNETEAQVVQAISHEFIEASTDPSIGDRAYSITDIYDPWSYFGGEVGDLCALVEPQWSEGSFTGIQRVYSNASAAAGGDPCLPAAAPYYGTDVTPRTAQEVSVGSSVTYDVVGWSTASVADWELSAELYINNPTTFNPTFSVSTSTINNGSHATVTVGIPAGTPSGSYALGLVFSSRSDSDYTSSLVEVYVP